MKVLQINTTVNSGSTGRIAEDIGKVLLANGFDSYIAYGRGNRPSSSEVVKIGNQFDFYLHGIISLLFDRHGFGSKTATKTLIRKIEEIKPDVIGLHNLHGYYLNIEVLFDYLKSKGIPVVWTLFDCWPFTGHCTYFDDISCEKWQSNCHTCPKTKRYPKSILIDNSKANFYNKKKLFTSLTNLHLVVHSGWLQQLVKKSFLKAVPCHHISSGIDLEIFKPTDQIPKIIQKIDKKIILGVASIWDKRKGLQDFIELNKLLKGSYQIVLVGLTKKQLKTLPNDLIGIQRTESVQELAQYYSAASVFVNPTTQDNFPTTNLEALACGTPVITYNTGGSPEAVNYETGIVVPKGDVGELARAIEKVMNISKDRYKDNCRKRALDYFNKDDRYLDYINLYKQIINKHQL